jgi:hypothetical protein
MVQCIPLVDYIYIVTGYCLKSISVTLQIIMAMQYLHYLKAKLMFSVSFCKAIHKKHQTVLKANIIYVLVII